MFKGIGDLPGTFDIPFNHKYKINSRPKGTRIIASKIATPVAGFHYPPTNSWCIQFGLGETLIGDKILSNFYYKICLKQNEEGQWSSSFFLHIIKKGKLCLNISMNYHLL